MLNRTFLASTLLAGSILGGAAYAAEPPQQHNATQGSAARAAVDKDVGKLSKEGAEGFRAVQLARLAIFEANPTQAKAMITRAQAAFAKAKTDDAVFNKAEAELVSPTDATRQQPGSQADKAAVTPGGKDQVAWVPVDAQLTLGDDFVATPAKASAVTEANKNLAHGDQKGALEKLRLADVDVNFTMAVLPLNKTLSEVDQAASLIEHGKYYEANAVLKTVQDGIRFDVLNVVAPQKAAATAGKSAPQAAGSNADDKPAK